MIRYSFETSFVISYMISLCLYMIRCSSYIPIQKFVWRRWFLFLFSLKFVPFCYFPSKKVIVGTIWNFSIGTVLVQLTPHFHTQKKRVNSIYPSFSRKIKIIQKPYPSSSSPITTMFLAKILAIPHFFGSATLGLPHFIFHRFRSH